MQKVCMQWVQTGVAKEQVHRDVWLRSFQSAGGRLWADPGPPQERISQGHSLPSSEIQQTEATEAVKNTSFSSHMTSELNTTASELVRERLGWPP
jgi:hypothetical protein